MARTRDNRETVRRPFVEVVNANLPGTVVRMTTPRNGWKPRTEDDAKVAGVPRTRKSAAKKSAAKKTTAAPASVDSPNAGEPNPNQ